MDDDTKVLPVWGILEKTYLYLKTNEKDLRPFWIVHFLLCAVFNLLPGGFSNPISLIWSLLYYVFWCVFFRF